MRWENILLQNLKAIFLFEIQIWLYEYFIFKNPDDGNKFSNAGTFLFNMVSILLTNLIFFRKITSKLLICI